MRKKRPKVPSARLRRTHARLLAVQPAQPRKELQRADRIRHAITSSAAELLHSLTPDHSIPKVLALIGSAVGVSRVQLYENRLAPDGRATAALRHEWDAPGTTLAAQCIKQAGIDPTTWDRDRLFPFLDKGETFGLLARGAKAPLDSILRTMDVKSVLVTPIFVGNRWWGQIGFDDCKQEREWSPTDVDTLKTMAELIGAAIGLTRDLQELSDASRIVENSPVLLFRISARPPYPLTYVSRNVSRFGYDAAELLATPLRYRELFHADDRAVLAIDITRIASGQIDALGRERRLRTSDGRSVWVDTQARPLRDDKHEVIGIEGIVIDIDERKTAEQELARSSLVDPVTGLPNRKAFMDQLARSFVVAERGGAGFAIHYIDLDRFKDINDVLGHSKGDELLKATAERLARFCRAGSDFIARFGGDEFAILQTPVSEASDAGAFAARVLRELTEPFHLGTELHITASVGIAVFARDVAGPEEMIKQADMALYRAKELGRNQFHFHSETLDTEIIERVMLGGDLRWALERGELEIYYQPQVDTETGQIIGLEALTRWHHPKHGLLCPTRFIPIAEKSGTILPLGRWVIDEVCRQISDWRAEHLSPPIVSINVSAEQLKSAAQFDRELAELLRRWNVEPSAVELELTESVLMETTQQHSKAIDQLRALGVAIAIDDFGTGYSSLGYLRAYHVNHIKIAQEFIQDIQVDSGDLAIVRAAISLGRELGIAVIAEGVETKHQLNILMEAGCRYVQGFYYSRPLPAIEAAQLLRRGNLAPAASLANTS